MKQILTKRGEVKALRQIFGVSEPTIISALHGRYDTELAQKIRKAAIERGGVEVK